MLRCAIVDCEVTPAHAVQLCGAGVDFVQLRDKAAAAGELARAGRMLLETFRGSATKLLVNSRADVALAIAADGVQLTSAPDELTVAQVRELFARARLPRAVVGVSCHSVSDVERAHDADLILFGPVFEKRVRGELVMEGAGVDALRAACDAAAPVPVLALGGVTEANAAQCLTAGAGGVAGIRFFGSDC